MSISMSISMSTDAPVRPQTRPDETETTKRTNEAPAGREKSVGTPVRRVDGPLKVTGTAPYAYEHDVENPCYLWPVPAPITKGKKRREPSPGYCTSSPTRTLLGSR